jgi:hypothetical protein
MWSAPAMEVGDLDDDGALEIVAIGGDVVARIDPVGEYWNDDAQQRMAALMAAAPELLAACERAALFLSEYGETDLVQRLRAAIAKTECVSST